MTRSAFTGRGSRRRMIASVISAATFTPMSRIDHAKPSSPAPARTFSSRARARWPVRKRMRSAMRGDFALAPGQSRPEILKRLYHLGRLERPQARGVIEVDATRKYLDHAFRRF